MTPNKIYRRGYPVAILVGIENDRAVLWKVFSHVVKPEKTVPMNGARSDPKALYNFHEVIINSMRPSIKEGVRSLIIASPARTNYKEKILEHIRSHHTWLIQGPSKAIFSELTGLAFNISDVTALTRTPEFRKLINETTEEESEDIMGLLEKRLNVISHDMLVLYSLEEIENQILGQWKIGKPQPEYLLMNDLYLSSSRQKNRLHKLMQIAANKKVKTRVVKADSAAGKRLAQLGGFVCVMKLD
jgi:stalled ribosome rescue protein Dom34